MLPNHPKAEAARRVVRVEENKLVKFRGDAMHRVGRHLSASGAERISLVTEQYIVPEPFYGKLPTFYMLGQVLPCFGAGRLWSVGLVGRLTPRTVQPLSDLSRPQPKTARAHQQGTDYADILPYIKAGHLQLDTRFSDVKKPPQQPVAHH